MKTSTRYALGTLLAFSWLASIWLGGYVFEYRFPSGWQYAWYAMPTVVTYAVLLFAHVFATAKLFNP
jgi:hypothetical protein